MQGKLKRLMVKPLSNLLEKNYDDQIPYSFNSCPDLANAMEYYETKSVGMGGGFLDEYERRPLHNLPKFVLIMP